MKDVRSSGHGEILSYNPRATQNRLTSGSRGLCQVFAKLWGWCSLSLPGVTAWWILLVFLYLVRHAGTAQL